MLFDHTPGSNKQGVNRPGDIMFTLRRLRSDSEKYQETKEGLQHLLTRSATDWGFRQKLLADPRAALEEHFGQALPVFPDILFIENEADATIVLPDYLGDELSEEEQEAVSGGAIYVTSDAGLRKVQAWLASQQ